MKQFLTIVILIGICIPLFFFINKSNKEEINNKVNSIGGQTISVEPDSFSSDDPYPWYKHGKGIIVYKFIYKKDNKIHTGWARFGDSNRDWIFK